MTDDWDVFGKIIASEYRKKIISSLYQKPGTPTQISERIEKHQSHVSKNLSELSDIGLVELRNPEASKGRIYTLTEFGEQTYEEMKNRGLLDD